jgi:hypothetical protein
MPVITRSQKKIASTSNAKKEKKINLKGVSLSTWFKGMINSHFDRIRAEYESTEDTYDEQYSNLMRSDVSSIINHLYKIRDEYKSNENENTYNEQYLNILRLRTEMAFIINEHLDDVINEDPDAITLVGPLTHIILTWLSYIKVHSQKTPTQCETIAANEIWKAAVTLSKYKPSQKQKIGLNFSAEDEHYNVYEEDEEDEDDEEEEDDEDEDDEDEDDEDDEDYIPYEHAKETRKKQKDLETIEEYDEDEETEEEKEDTKDEDYDPDNEEDILQVVQDLEDDKNYYDFVVEE